MKKITIVAAFPYGKDIKEWEELQNFTAQLEQFYSRFSLHVELKEYTGKIEKNEKGLFSVKGMRRELMDYTAKSVFCSFLLFCKKEELDPDDMNNLIRSLVQMKKAEIAAYFRPAEGMQPVRNDLIRRIAAVDARIIVPREDRKRLSDMAKQYMTMAFGFERERKLKEAEAAYREALVIQKKLVKADENTYLQDISFPYHNLGTLYFQSGRYEEAEQMYKSALDARRRLVSQKGEAYLPLVAASGNALGALYLQRDKTEEAEKLFTEVMDIRRKLVNDQDDRSQIALADICGNMGNLYHKQKKIQEAIAVLNEALTILTGLLIKYEKDSATGKETMESLRKKAAATSNTLGILQGQMKQPEEAIRRYRQAVELYEEMAKDKPEENNPLAAMVTYNLFHIYRSQKMVQEAAEAHQKSYMLCMENQKNPLCSQLLGIMKKEIEQDRKRQAETADQLAKQAKEQHENGLFEEAIRTWNQAAKLYSVLPDSENQAKAALAYTELGLLYWDTRQIKEAEKSYKTSLHIYQILAEKDKIHLPEVAVASYNLGIFYQEIREEDVNEYLRLAFETAGQCLDLSEQCREIYENLEDEPLYDDLKKETAEGTAEDTVTTAEAEGEKDFEIAEGLESAETESEKNSSEAEKSSEKKSGGWFRKLFGKK